MNPKTLVRLSNIVGIISILLLIYWVFVFITVEVFGLRVFRENITEIFYMSVLGILALMVGALIINIMFNLTRIAQKHNQDEDAYGKTKGKRLGLIFALSFPLIGALLFGGDYLTSKKKERLLIKTAKSIIENHSDKAENLVNYSFDEDWILKTEETLQLLSKTDKNFPNVSVLAKDTIDKSKVYLGFEGGYVNYHLLADTISPQKEDYIHETTQPEREYLDEVFDKGEKEVRFSAHDGRYELFYPYGKNGKMIVFHFSDYQRFGKIGK